VREVFGSALDAAGRVLGTLGYSEREAESIVRRFREYDEQQIVRNAPHRQDMKKLIALTEQGRRDIAELLAAEARSAPQVDEDDAGGDGEGRARERSADRL
jgi:CPA2 family monovalent cation:H+ antiporter-2